MATASDTHQPGGRDPAGRRATDDFDLAVVAPARDEGGNLTPLVAEITAAFSGSPLKVQVVIVDDGSADATVARATEAGATVIELGVNQGLGAAVRV
ncbi:MAG: glycosyltransferase, partial [Planctomycetota bacterium]